MLNKSKTSSSETIIVHLNIWENIGETKTTTVIVKKTDTVLKLKQMVGVNPDDFVLLDDQFVFQKDNIAISHTSKKFDLMNRIQYRHVILGLFQGKDKAFVLFHHTKDGLCRRYGKIMDVANNFVIFEDGFRIVIDSIVSFKYDNEKERSIYHVFYPNYWDNIRKSLYQLLNQQVEIRTVTHLTFYGYLSTFNGEVLNIKEVTRVETTGKSAQYASTDLYIYLIREVNSQNGSTATNNNFTQPRSVNGVENNNYPSGNMINHVSVSINTQSNLPKPVSMPVPTNNTNMNYNVSHQNNNMVRIEKQRQTSQPVNSNYYYTPSNNVPMTQNNSTFVNTNYNNPMNTINTKNNTFKNQNNTHNNSYHTVNTVQNNQFQNVIPNNQPNFQNNRRNNQNMNQVNAIMPRNESFLKNLEEDYARNFISKPILEEFRQYFRTQASQIIFAETHTFGTYIDFVLSKLEITGGKTHFFSSRNNWDLIWQDHINHNRIYYDIKGCIDKILELIHSMNLNTLENQIRSIYNIHRFKSELIQYLEQLIYSFPDTIKPMFMPLLNSPKNLDLCSENLLQSFLDISKLFDHSKQLYPIPTKKVQYQDILVDLNDRKLQTQLDLKNKLLNKDLITLLLNHWYDIYHNKITQYLSMIEPHLTSYTKLSLTYNNDILGLYDVLQELGKGFNLSELKLVRNKFTHPVKGSLDVVSVSLRLLDIERLSTELKRKLEEDNRCMGPIGRANRDKQAQSIRECDNILECIVRDNDFWEIAMRYCAFYCVNNDLKTIPEAKLWQQLQLRKLEQQQ